MATQLADPAAATSAARAVAVWWANQLAAPTFDNGARGEPLYRLMAGALGQRIAAQDPPTEEQLERFTEDLERRVAAGLEAGLLGRLVILSVDYGADQMLSEAADAAAITQARFPWKTVSWARPDHVTASGGYGGGERLVWAAPDWERPACNRHRHEGERPVEGVCSRPRYHEEECGDWRPDPDRCTVCRGTYAQHYNAEVLDHMWRPVAAENLPDAGS